MKVRIEEMKEIDIKLKIVEFLLNSEPADTYLAAEVRFSFGSRRADIVSVSSDIATVYEIKSEKDSVERLVYQIDSYKEYFDYCYIVCVDKNLDAVRRKLAPMWVLLSWMILTLRELERQSVLPDKKNYV